MFGDFKVQIIERPGIVDNRVFLWRASPGAMEFITHKAEVRIVKDAEAVKDEELYFADLSQDQLQAFADALANKGIKTRNDSIAEGKLIATEKHLEDMRTLALPNPNPKQYKVKGDKK